MKKEEYSQLVHRIMQSIKKAMAGDAQLRELFEVGLELDFMALPKHRQTIRTLKGIEGYLWHCDATKTPRPTFVFNALHDLSECVKNHTENWFSPRLSRFVDYEPQNKELMYY